MTNNHHRDPLKSRRTAHNRVVRKPVPVSLQLSKVLAKCCHIVKRIGSLRRSSNQSLLPRAKVFWVVHHFQVPIPGLLKINDLGLPSFQGGRIRLPASLELHLLNELIDLAKLFFKFIKVGGH